MGRYYALYGEKPQDERVANAIAEHYKPLGPADSCPTIKDSMVVALADKFDTIAAFFRIDERPTGSGDPFALRRAALGVIRIILENGLRLPLTTILALAVDPILRLQPDEVLPIVRSLTDFLADRLWVHLRNKGVRQDLIAAVFAVHEDDLIRLLARVDALQSFLDSDDGTNLLTAYRRASNIVSIEEQKDNCRYNDQDDDPRKASQLEEQRLSHTLTEIGLRSAEFIHDERFVEAMTALAELRGPIDEFFERVTVNAPEKELRENRLRLLARIRATMNQVADFSQIEG
jgi:glycyl-tRNA synthetase beta chain